jgi:NAD(P)H-hydrate repair Nnr-like enzyme with NAD(P)H-hydrate dehydratase domain
VIGAWVRGWAIKVGAAVVAGALIWSHAAAYRAGADRVEARYEREAAELRAERDKALRVASQREAARLAAEEAATRLAQELEDAARADPGADAPALGADSVRRLQAR